jgi:dihydroxy-acid dehydratase
MERSACPTCGSCSGMFTANSMNCLTEALGLSLPGNGSTLATHADREQLFLGRAARIVELCPPLLRAGRRLGAAALDRQLRGLRERDERSTSPWAARPTPCCTCWPPRTRRASTSRWPTSTASVARVPCLCKVAPATPTYHMEDVHRAGGIMAILGELDRAGLINRDVPTVHSPSMGEALDCWDVKRNRRRRCSPSTVPHPAACRPRLRSPRTAATELDIDRANGCIRDKAHAFSQDGGLAVLYGNIAEKGCIVKTAGVDESILEVHRQGARVCQSQEEAVGEDPRRPGVAGDIVVVVRYEGPKGGPGMQEMLYPTSI